MEYLSVDVQSAIMRVQDLLQQFIAQQPLMDGDDGSEEGPGWSWSYPRLVRALMGMQGEDFSIIHTPGDKLSN